MPASNILQILYISTTDCEDYLLIYATISFPYYLMAYITIIIDLVYIGDLQFYYFSASINKTD